MSNSKKVLRVSKQGDHMLKIMKADRNSLEKSETERGMALMETPEKVSMTTVQPGGRNERGLVGKSQTFQRKMLLDRQRTLTI
jgi:hypothetical protein